MEVSVLAEFSNACPFAAFALKVLRNSECVVTRASENPLRLILLVAVLNVSPRKHLGGIRIGEGVSQSQIFQVKVSAGAMRFCSSA